MSGPPIERRAGLPVEPGAACTRAENAPPSPAELAEAVDAHAIVSVADEAGRIVYVNDRFCDVSGYARAELIGANHRIVKSGAHDAAFYRAMWQTIAVGQVWRGTIQNRSKDGRPYWVSSTIVPVPDRSGRPRRYVSLRTDITRQVLLEQEMRHQHAFISAVADAIGEGVLVVDAADRCLYASAEALRLLRMRREALLGRSLQQALGLCLEGAAPADAAHWPHGRHQATLRRGSGARLHVELNLRPFAGDGAPAGTVIAFRPNASDRRARSRERMVSAAAERASRAKSAFLAQMSHEIRTPLAAIVGLARLALDEPADSPRLQPYLRRLLDGSLVLSGLVSDVLDLAKIEAGKLVLQHAAFDLPELLHGAIDSVFDLARERGLALRLELDPALPRHVLGDALRVRQIVTNYLSNALKFTTRGSVELRASPLPAGRVRIEVADTGIGITPEALARLFVPFSQVPGVSAPGRSQALIPEPFKGEGTPVTAPGRSQALRPELFKREGTPVSARPFGGSGLGLSICRDLARAMGGQAGAASVPGAGSLFWVEIELPHAPVPSPPPLPPQADLAGIRVLLVEDNEVNRIIARALLERWGASVVEATQGAEALQALQAQDEAGTAPIDVVLMDLHMPVMGGREATERIRQRNDARRLPIVALTAAAMDHERQECLALGMDDYLTKPINPEALLASLTRVCRGSSR